MHARFFSAALALQLGPQALQVATNQFDGSAVGPTIVTQQRLPIERVVGENVVDE